MREEIPHSRSKRTKPRRGGAFSADNRVSPDMKTVGLGANERSRRESGGVLVSSPRNYGLVVCCCLHSRIAHGVARLAPSGDGIKDDFYRGRSHLNEVHVVSRLSLNSLPLGLQKIFYLLQLTHQLFDFCNRCSSNFLNKWRNIRVISVLGVEGAST
jgi:hypothetical protein